MAKTPAPPGSIDFELTDLADARRNLNVLPPGVEEAKRMQPGYWEQVRRPLGATDRALTGRAMEWVVHLPAELRPQHLCERHPRIANLIAEAWHDVPRCNEVLHQLIHDERGGRRGFATEVNEELVRLSDHRSGTRA